MDPCDSVYVEVFAYWLTDDIKDIIKDAKVIIEQEEVRVRGEGRCRARTSWNIIMKGHLMLNFAQEKIKKTSKENDGDDDDDE